MVKSICLRYLIVLIVTIISIAFISFILQAYFQINIGSSASIVTLFIPALNAGTTYYQKTGTAPSSKIRWQYAFYFTGIQIGLAATILSIVSYIFPEIYDVLTSITAALFIGFVAFYILLILVVSRLFFGMGINTMEKTSKRI